MRIAFVLTQDLQSPSGLGRYFPLARQLASRGHAVHISALHPNYQGLTAKHLRVENIQVNYVAPMHVRKQGNLKTYYGVPDLLGVTLRASWALSLDILRARADIVHVGKPHPMNSVAGLFSRLSSSGSLCVDCDDYEAGSMHFSSDWQRKLVAFFERTVPKIGRLVTVNTHFMRQKLLDWGIESEKIVYLPNGVERERIGWNDPDRVNALRQTYGLSGRRVIAYIGSLSLASHAVDLLLKAFAQLRNETPGAALLIVGGGGDYPAIVEMAAQMGLGDSVVFTGRVAPEDVGAHYQLAEVTVDPVYDNDAARGRSPLKLFESWAGAIPFVTSRVGDRTSILESSRAGVLASDSTPEAYAQAILQVLSSKSYAEQLRRNGLIEVQQYTWDHLVDRLEQAYIRISGKAQAGEEAS